MPRFVVALQNNATPAQLTDVLNVLKSEGARPLQAWGQSVLFAEGTPAAEQAVQTRPGVASVTGAAIPNLAGLNLDALATAFTAAWNFGFLPGFLNPPAPPSPLPSILAPGGCGAGGAPAAGGLGVTTNGILGPASDAAYGLTPTLTNSARRALVGTVGVAVVYIDGPAGSTAEFTVDDRLWILKGLTDAFDGLHKVAPTTAHLLFTPAIHNVKLTVQPSAVPTPANPANPATAEYETLEAVWRDPALTKLGVGTGRAGFRALVNASTFTFKPDWGLVILVTKYRAAWPAYAPDYRDVVVSFDMVKNQIGLAQLAFVIAHEIGHTVGARDEYASSNCSVLDKCGFSNAPNVNCEIIVLPPNPLLGPNPVVAPNLASVPCLMKGGTFTCCPTTFTHFGWGDQNGNGVLDPYDPLFAPFP